MGNFDHFSRFPIPTNRNFFFYLSSGYMMENTLYDKLLTEAYNHHGVKMDYYVVTYDTNYDPIFGEDNNRRIFRRFPIMTYYTLPQENDVWQPGNLQVIDNFHLYVSKRHFAAASRLDNSGRQSYSPYIPKVGDILKSRYNNFYYEITHVAEEEEMFHQRKHSWDLVVVQFKDQHISVSATGDISTDSISAVSNKSENNIFNIKDYIDTTKGTILYTSASNEIPPKDPYGGW